MTTKTYIMPIIAFGAIAIMAWAAAHFLALMAPLWVIMFFLVIMILALGISGLMLMHVIQEKK